MEKPRKHDVKKGAVYLTVATGKLLPLPAMKHRGIVVLLGRVQKREDD